jgi:hypothetical protein
VAAFAQLADTSGQHVYDGANPFVDWQLSEVLKAVPELHGLKPAASQEELPGILDKVGERIQALLEVLPDTSAREDIAQEELTRNGRVYARRVRSFGFLILVHRSGAKVALEEYRTDSQGKLVEPQSEDEFAVTADFTTSWAHFHPGNRLASRFSLLGQQKLERRNTYVVAFAQRPGWATVVGTFVKDRRSVLILFQGIAWIDVESYQILRMRTDLLAPREEVDLKRQTTEIEFGAVRFPGVSSPRWLPRDVVVTIESKARILRNRHHYSHYQLFRSESAIKPG